MEEVAAKENIQVCKKNLNPRRAVEKSANQISQG